MSDDLTDAARRVLAGGSAAQVFVEQSIAAAQLPAAAHAFISTSFTAAREAAALADRRVASRADPGPLAGLAVSIKDLFDVAGEVTSAGSRLLASAPPAAADAPAVQRLRRAGAGLIGRTNMSEFAFSGVGINPHHGTPANAATARLDPAPRIPGGSTSGGAVSVALGAAWAALGSDTGGSIRIPAALQGLVGFKSTARLVPTEGAVPLSTTLDTVSAITRTVRDAVVLHELLAERTVAVDHRETREWRLAVPQALMLDGLDATVAAAFDRCLAALGKAGFRIEIIDLPLLGEIPAITALGGFAPVEAWAFHRRWLAEREADYDPRVARRIRRGEAMSAADYIDLVAARTSWIARMERAVEGFDALLSPTVPIVAPEIDALLGNDDRFFAVNAQLLRNPSAINLLDGCALSLPCHAPDEFPVGLMVWGTALRDDAVLSAGLAIESVLRHRL